MFVNNPVGSILGDFHAFLNLCRSMYVSSMRGERKDDMQYRSLNRLKWTQ